METIVIKGITWGHSRGITPLLAVAQRYNELHPNVELRWTKRSLQEFADYPIEKLTEHYDLLIIDHPWVGCAAATGCVLPLEQYLSTEYLEDQKNYSTGNSHESYLYEGHQWALAIDAATPVASYRADLLQKAGHSIPQTWEEVLALAKKNKVALPAIPIDLLMNFYMFCLAHGEEPFTSKEEIVSEQTGIKALQTMKELYSLIDPRFFECNPIAVAEIMSTTDDYFYCPFAYGYSNYSRNGYAAQLLLYSDLVSFDGKKLKSTIGGTGIAVSAFSAHKNIAIDIAQMLVDGKFQSTFYVEHGGQPGHRMAWEDVQANRLTNNYFSTVLPAMERGYTRPRYNGYLHFQDKAGDYVQEYLMKEIKPESVLDEINSLYQKSLATELNLQP